PPSFTPHGGLVPPGYFLTVTNPNPSGIIYFTTDGSDPRVWGGAVSSSAQVYTAPLVLTNALFLRVRVRDGANWSALDEATFYVVQDYSRLAVTEIMYNPQPGTFPGDDYEFLELKNTGPDTLDLSGLQFTRGITFQFTNGTRLASGAFVVLARNPAAFAARYPGVALKGLYLGRLDNGGENLELAHVLGTNVFSFAYNNAVPWPITPDGYGFSLVRASLAGSPDLASSWRPSSNSGGSPGADDPPPAIPAIIINEILTHTVPPSVDWIELHNPTASPVVIGGWFLTDDPAQPKKFRIPTGTILPAGGFVVFDETSFNPSPGIFPSFALSSGGESLYLFSGDAGTNLTGYSHSFTYGAAATGVSFGRYVISTGEEQWPAMNSISPGAINSGPRVGPVVINEIQYHPAAGYDEFVELYNTSAIDVPLFDTSRPTNQWRLNGLGFAFSNNVTMGAGQHLLIVNIDPAAFRAKYAVSSAIPVIGPYPGRLQDSGENLELQRPDAPGTNGVPFIVVDAVRYNDRLPWPPGADGDGPSLQRRSPLVYGNEPTNWFASGITPGGTNVFNTPPSCSWVTPADGAIYMVPVDVTLTAAATDPDGSIARVEFYDGDVPLGQATIAPYTMIWSNAPVGVHTLVAKARDNGLAVTPSQSITITVNPPPLGSGIGLRADYHDNIDFTGLRVRRIDPVVDFDWGSGQPDPAIGAEQFSVRWIGQVQPRFNETYTFYTVSDDGVRLWVNNQLLIDNWTDHGPTENTGFLPLQAGYLYDIKMEMYENGGGAVARLLWSSLNVPKETIPSSQLYPPASSNVPPTVVITSPATGAVFVATSTVAIDANASDLDGAVYKVEFYDGGSKLGEDINTPFSFSWGNVSAGQHFLRAIATDDSGLSRTSAPVAITVRAGFTSNLTFIATGAVWKYLDNGTDAGTSWPLIGFNDGGWSSGPAQLGYGDGDERTVTSFGPNAGAKFITTYFRRAFTVSDYSAISSLALRVLRDDGVVIYLNGTEVYRNNLPSGPVGYLTLAPVSIGGVDESAWNAASIAPGGLVNDVNVIAVGVHQNAGSSSDISFDFELTGVQNFIAPYILTQPRSQTVGAGSAVSLEVAAAGTGPLGYQWRRDNTSLPGATNATLAWTAVQPSETGNYSVVISNMAGTMTSTVATLTVSTDDTDGDGLPDAWELAHGTNPNLNDATMDLDGDLLTNLAEYIAGTDPQDGDSFLKVSAIESGGGKRLIWFNAVSNRTYSVVFKNTTEAAAWTRLADVPAHSTNRFQSVVDGTPVSNQRYYRLVTPALP
ncbi:MAG TPA: lamin tail domain-containing protein, partial [Verrucomicrobiae bacterium]|nr:lamin tail domain-containing protein [Verrucomicrobiae bacterium]